MIADALSLAKARVRVSIRPRPCGRAGSVGHERIDFETHPDRYRHWKLSFPDAYGGDVARLAIDVKEDGGAASRLPAQAQLVRPRRRHRARRRAPAHSLRAPGDAGRRRHERQGPHLLLGREHLHARQLEPRLQGELLQVHERDAPLPRRDERGERHPEPRVAQRHRVGRRLRARDRVRRDRPRDDGSSAVSFPEAPLLAVLPGTGGLTRLVDKRKIRRDLADVFSTIAEGVRGKRAVEWGLVDESAERASSRPRSSAGSTR